MGEAPESRIVLRREYAAPARDLVRAWLEPELVRRWFRPLRGVAPERVSIEPVVGGCYELEYAPSGAARFAIAGRILALDASRIALELARRDGAAADPAARSRVELRWREGPRGLSVELEHSGVARAERADTEAGWNACLAALPAAFEASLEHFYARMQSFPRFRSRFGGTWPDLSDARARLAGKRALTRKSLVAHFCPLDVDPQWFGAIESSPKLEHAPGCWYCHPLR
jgi:uncharacterized protein YndB with AHSA1/START domain